VAEKSGINQWNGWLVEKENLANPIFQYPKNFTINSPEFFPGRDVRFRLLLPEWKNCFRQSLSKKIAKLL
jgi:hypothetical protein